MSNAPIRRSQLIAPFGVGAMFVTKEGNSLICGGLDQWFKKENGGNVDIGEFEIREWRLERMLQVEHFRLPPDYRYYKKGERPPNAELTVPFLRFPGWHHCRYCGSLEQYPLTVTGKLLCRRCKERGFTRNNMVQVQFVAICQNGHMQEFPWREWAHKSTDSTCNRALKLYSTGGTGLGSMVIECECGKRETMGRVTMVEGNKTELTKVLNMSCHGSRPWLADENGDGESCECEIRGSLRSASNVYFAKVHSAISLPQGNNEISSELIELLSGPPLSTLIHTIKQLGGAPPVALLRNQHRAILNDYSDEEIEVAVSILELPLVEEPELDLEQTDQEYGLRREEYNVFQSEKNESFLKIRKINISEYDHSITRYLSKITLIDKLKETRVLAGFNRIYPENSTRDIDGYKHMLWRDPAQETSWLPGYVVYGEGIFVELNQDLLAIWEQRPSVKARIRVLQEQYLHLQQSNRISERVIDPRYVLLHTFSHILMNQLTFECGYSSAALRERLYVSSNPEKPMAAILIYTAAGDAEGTMGGLVRMGKPGYLEPIILAALQKAEWCSSDPVCMESGERGGQGPDSCNLSACHSCALVPETACEDFNRFLDRGLLTGSLNDPTIGFFQQ